MTHSRLPRFSASDRETSHKSRCARIFANLYECRAEEGMYPKVDTIHAMFPDIPRCVSPLRTLHGVGCLTLVHQRQHPLRPSPYRKRRADLQQNP